MIVQSCKHGIPLFQSCSDCGREMVKSPLTPQFLSTLKPVSMVHGSSFTLFPKPVKKPKKTMRDYAKNMAKNKRRKAVPAKIKRKRMPSIKSLKNKADLLFSKFIRERDIICVLHNNKCKGAVQCGHLIKRGKMITRYDEVNCNALCEYHNYLDNFEHDHYVSWFVREYGALPYLDLVEKSKSIKQMKRQDYLDIISKYEKINSLPKL